MMPSQSLPEFTTHLDDSSVHYTEAGTGDVVLLIHGSLCDYRYWRWQIPTLSPSYRVVAPSLRGFWPEAFQREDARFSIEQHAEDMLAFARHIGQEQPVHILGHSRGAHVALEMACAGPELVRSLTLADPGFRIGGEPSSPSVHTRVAALLDRGEIEQGLSEFVDTVNGPGTWRQMVGWFKTMVKDNAYTLLSQIREVDLSIDLARARQLRHPILLVGGANSPARYGSRLDALEKALDCVSRVTIPHASHGMNLANPKAFNQALVDFFGTMTSP
ncbi:alpha/beta fold hydrolase [Pollutimonas nitritireducens]|nr:alpha/beta hydrolase [Pollutimonas nitritireducens]